MIKELINKWKTRNGTWKTIWFTDGTVSKTVYGVEVGDVDIYAIIEYNEIKKEARAYKVDKSTGERYNCKVQEFCLISENAREVCEKYNITW
jgi:uncharacterized protein (UPF0264 family)